MPKVKLTRPEDGHSRTSGTVTRFRQLPEPVALLRLNDGIPVFYDLTEKFAEALNLDTSQIFGRSIADLFGATAGDFFHQGLTAAMAGEACTLRIPLVRGDQVESRIFMFRAGENSHIGERCLVALERRNRSTFLAESGQNLTSINGHLFFLHDVVAERTHYMNPTLARCLGLPERGLDIRQLMRRLHHTDWAAFRACLRALPGLADGQVLTLTGHFRDTKRQWRSLLVRIGGAERDRRGRLAKLIGVIEDFTDHAALNGVQEAAAQHVLDIEARERRRIARELHDSTAQHFVAIDLGLTGLSLQDSPTKKAENETLAQIRHALAEAQKEIRSFSYLLHPPQVAKDGLQHALTSFLEGFSRRAGLAIDTLFNGPLNSLSPQIARALFRVAQEAVMNIHRHAGASHAQVALAMDDNGVTLDITDNGVGMATDAPLGVGLYGMKARMKEMGGDITFANTATGFHLHARCPLHLLSDRAP